MNVVGPRVKYFREQQHLSQEQLAARCNLIEWDISRSSLAKIESRGRRVTDIEVLLLSHALKVSVNKLLND